MPGLGIVHTLKRWLGASGVRPAPVPHWVRARPRCVDPGGPSRTPARVIAGLTPGHLRVALLWGEGRMTDSSVHVEIPLDRVPFACRMPNTPLWITTRDNDVVAVEPRVP